jgi:hypothetical protein
MTGTRLAFLLSAPLALVACWEQPEMPKPVASRLPDKVCKQVREGLEKAESSGALQQMKPGEVVMEEQAWLQMTQSTRDQVTKLVAFDAACRASEPPMEQTAIVRNEYGRVMAQPIIATSADLSTLLAE